MRETAVLSLSLACYGNGNSRNETTSCLSATFAIQCSDACVLYVSYVKRIQKSINVPIFIFIHVVELQPLTQARPTRSSRMLHATQCYVALGCICNE
jgi:hypothetical protein